MPSHHLGLSDCAVNKQLAQTVGMADVACLYCQTLKTLGSLVTTTAVENHKITAIYTSSVAIALSFILQHNDRYNRHLIFIVTAKSWMPSYDRFTAGIQSIKFSQL